MKKTYNLISFQELQLLELALFLLALKASLAMAELMLDHDIRMFLGAKQQQLKMALQ